MVGAMSAEQGSLGEGPNVTETRSSSAASILLATTGQLELPMVTIANDSPRSIHAAVGVQSSGSSVTPSGMPG
ncbi:hypothetical protein BOH66_03785 [Microbacterium aurum]|uniref:Uncharacterized protein n=1 Tax=Microbacterium aurum TaxID=36805 RepID=A0A1P8U5U4_9MICO|nr:hypothetical protein BOH66_03785 [Microbacterium aurum]